MFCDHDFQYQTNPARPRTNPPGWDLPSLRGYVYSRHELVGPYPSKWTSGMVIKKCPCKNIPRKQQRRSKLLFLEDLGADFQMSSHRVVAQSFLGARELQSGPLFGLDTSSDGTCDARSLTFATNVTVLCVPVAEQVSGTNPRWLPKYWAESRRQWCVVITLQLQVPRCTVSMFFHHLCFSEILWMKDSFLWIQDARSLRMMSSFLHRLCSKPFIL